MATDRGYPWLKIYPLLLEDPKWLRLSDGAKARYVEFCLIAGRADAGGLLILGDDPATVEDLAFALRRNEAEVATQIVELERAGLLEDAEDGWFLPRFQDEQGPSQAEKREGWKKRQAEKRRRAREKRNGEIAPEARTEDEDEAQAQAQALALEVTGDKRTVTGDTPVTGKTAAAAEGRCPDCGKPLFRFSRNDLYERTLDRLRTKHPEAREAWIVDAVQDEFNSGREGGCECDLAEAVANAESLLSQYIANGGLPLIGFVDEEGRAEALVFASE